MTTPLLFALLLVDALATPNGSSGKLLYVRRKSHLLQAEWYAHLAKAGERERKAENQTDIRHSPFIKD